MSLYTDWKQLLENFDSNDAEQGEALRTGYYDKEEQIYSVILGDMNTVVSGKVEELAQRFDMDITFFAGFLDGINDSLKKPMDLEKLKKSTAVKLEVDPEKLYFNMLEAKADWLYNLPQWDSVLTQDKKKEIAKQRRLSKQAVSKKIDRNGPCICGSGKKYKKCCGLSA